MVRLIRLAALGIVSQYLGLVLFVEAGRAGLSGVIKTACLGGGAVGSILVLVAGGILLSLPRAIVCAVIMALTGVLAAPILGITVYPGLIKDEEVFSAEYLVATAIMGTCLVAIHTVVVCGAWAARLLWSRSLRGRERGMKRCQELFLTPFLLKRRRRRRSAM